MEAQESNKKQNLKSDGKILLIKMEMSYKKHHKASKLNKVQGDENLMWNII
jgi:putative heme iron utilization protein